MANETPAMGTPAAGETPNATTPAPSPTPAAAATPETPAEGEPKVYTADYVQRLNRESAERRTKIGELEGKLKTFEEAQLSEQEKLSKRAAAAEKALADTNAALKSARASVAVTQAALTVGIAPELAQRLVDVAFDDAGAPVDPEPALRALLKAHPNLALAGSTSGVSATNGARSAAAAAASAFDPKNPPRLADRGLWKR